MMTRTVILGTAETSVRDIADIAYGAQVLPDPSASDARLIVHEKIRQAIDNNKVIYGLTTGVGDLVTQRLSPEQISDVQLNMLKSHACGTGPVLAQHEVRAMMAVMMKSLLQGFSGVSPALVQTMAVAEKPGRNGCRLRSSFCEAAGSMSNRRSSRTPSSSMKARA